MAERLVVELKDRLPVAAGAGAGEERDGRELGCRPEVYRDAVAAMVSLGYTNAAATAAAKGALAEHKNSAPMALDELLRRALRTAG